MSPRGPFGHTRSGSGPAPTAPPTSEVQNCTVSPRQVDRLIAERDALAARVAELEAIVQKCANANEGWRLHDEGCEYATEIHRLAYHATNHIETFDVAPPSERPQGCDCP